MMPLSLARTGAPLRLLCLGAHCDDIEIGCGATVLDLIGSGVAVEVAWCVVGSTPARATEAKASAAAFLEGAVAAHIDVQAFRDGHFHWQGSAIDRKSKPWRSPRWMMATPSSVSTIAYRRLSGCEACSTSNGASNAATPLITC